MIITQVSGVHISTLHLSLFTFSGSQPISFIHGYIHNLESFLFSSGNLEKPKKQKTNKHDGNVQKWHFAQANETIALCH